MTPQELAQHLNRRFAGTLMEHDGIEILSAGEGHARARVEFKPELGQVTGLFHAGVIMGLADTTATVAAMWEFDPHARLQPERFPLSIQMSTNLIRNTNHGALIADAELVHRGRTTVIADVRVTDDQARLIAKASVTLLAPKGPSH
jgi:1,4-dihydroxy-2-naphthoyl-CoA hydrolase